MATPEAISPLPLDHPAYTTTARRGLGLCLVRQSALNAFNPSVGVRLLRRFLPAATKAWHACMADLHARKSLEHDQAWGTTADLAATACWGRPFMFLDYRISGIASDEFSPEHQDLLRHHAQASSGHLQLAVLHRMAAGYRHQSALMHCRAIARPAELTRKFAVAA